MTNNQIFDISFKKKMYENKEEQFSITNMQEFSDSVITL